MKAKVRNHVKAHREHLGLTQRELGAAAGVSRQSIISIERGRYVPSLPLALKLAEVLECRTDELFQRVSEDDAG